MICDPFSVAGYYLDIFGYHYSILLTAVPSLPYLRSLSLLVDMPLSLLEKNMYWRLVTDVSPPKSLAQIPIKHCTYAFTMTAIPIVKRYKVVMCNIQYKHFLFTYEMKFASVNCS